MSLNKLPTIIKTESLISTPFFQLRKEQLSLSEQDDYDYYVLEPEPIAVMVVATTAQNEYILNWEYRHPVKEILLGCPGGIQDRNETPLACAARELWEETGFKADQFELIGASYPLPGICTQQTLFVRAYNAVDSQTKGLDRAEFIQSELFTAEEIRSLIKNKTPVDGLLLTALFFEWTLRSQN